MPKGIGNFFNRITGRDQNQNAQNYRRMGLQPPQVNLAQPQIAQGAGPSSSSCGTAIGSSCKTTTAS